MRRDNFEFAHVQRTHLSRLKYRNIYHYIYRRIYRYTTMDNRSSISGTYYRTWPIKV